MRREKYIALIVAPCLVSAKRGVNTQINRFASLDKLKTLMAFLVVAYHARIPGVFADYLYAFSKFAVPVFFMITGFFYSSASAKKQIHKLIRLLVIASALFFVLTLVQSTITGTVQSFLETLFSFRNAVYFLVFNQGLPETHLWYLRAILYTLFTVSFLDGRGKLKYLYYLVPILLIADLTFGTYSKILLHREFFVSVARNWMFTGIPYFMIGYAIRLHHEKIETFLGDHRKEKLIGIIIASCILTFLGKYLLIFTGNQVSREHYLSTTFLSIGVFLYFLFYVSQTENNVSYIGKHYSGWIYLLHPIPMVLMEFLPAAFTNNIVFLIFRPFLVFLITTVLIAAVMDHKVSHLMK